MQASGSAAAMQSTSARLACALMTGDNNRQPALKALIHSRTRRDGCRECIGTALFHPQVDAALMATKKRRHRTTYALGILPFLPAPGMPRFVRGT